ncbi:MAG: hypothetical protein Q9162_004030 [Coniocarpon cinnabarinum]
MDPRASTLVQCLASTYRSYDFDTDPYIIELRENSDASVTAQRAIDRRQTFCTKQLKIVLNQSIELETNVGPTAADWFLRKCTGKMQSIPDDNQALFTADWSQSERAHLMEIMQSICESEPVGFDQAYFSSKFQTLVSTLLSRAGSTRGRLTCIVFARQRATVSALTHFLSNMSDVQSYFSCGSFVGSAAYSSRRSNLGELADVKAQKSFLGAFRAGSINLMVSTDVLEEGIDIPACNLVICFDPPQHLTSFIQRRGRARQGQSEYLIMLPNDTAKILEWQTAENMLLQIYADEERQRSGKQQIEEMVEDADEEFRIEETGVPADGISDTQETAGALLDVNPLFSPWMRVARCWLEEPLDIHAHELSMKSSGRTVSSGTLLWPAILPSFDPFTVYLDHVSTLQIGVKVSNATWKGDLNAARQANKMLNQNVFRNLPLSESTDFIAVLVPNNDLNRWLNTVQRDQSLQKISDKRGLITLDHTRPNVPHICISSEWAVPTALPTRRVDETGVQIPAEPTSCALLKRIARPRNFLQRMAESQQKADLRKRKQRLVPLDVCSTNKITWSEALPAYILPSILRHLRNAMVAEELRTTILAPVALSRTDLIFEAICSSRASEQVNYQRLEFLGDCVLKLLTAMHVMAERPNAPEAQLTAIKEHIVSNKRLAKAALAKGLDKFIIDDRFTGSYTNVPTINDVLAESETAGAARQMSRKTVADVVESLIGAAFLEGSGPGNDIEAGLAKALDCVSLFFEDIQWQSLKSMKAQILKNELPPSSHYEAYASKLSSERRCQLKEMLGHIFQHAPLLITALTHPSQNTDISLRTYDRLELLGDALLDLQVTTYLFRHEPALSQGRLHTLRTCCVNEHLLSHACMSRTISIQRTTKPSLAALNNGIAFEPSTEISEHPLWHFMPRDTMSYELSNALNTASAAHDSQSSTITSMLESGKTYPWSELMSVGAPKCMSDIIESILAAVWLDADTGSINDAFAAAELLLEQFGIQQVMQRLTSDNVEGMNPKERLYVLAKGESVEFKSIKDDESSNAETLQGDEDDEIKMQATMTLLVAGQEVAHRKPESVKTTEAMTAGKVNELNQWRLAVLAIGGWNEEGGGAEIVRNVKAQRAAEKAAKEGENDESEDGEDD